jgi:hypothetical protein
MVSSLNPESKAKAYLVLQLHDELLVAWQHICPILNETAERPQPKWGFAVLFHDIQMRVIHASSHLSDLLNDRVDSL